MGGAHFAAADDAHFRAPFADLVVVDAVDGFVGPLCGIVGSGVVPS